MKLRHSIVTAFILLLAVSSLAGTIRFKRGSTVPTGGEKGEPLWQTQGGFNGKGQLWIGYSTPQGRTAYKAYSSFIPVFGRDYFDGATIQPLFCNISGGTVSYQYDQAGLNPAPASTAMKLRLWLGNSRITPKHNRWDAAGIVYGNRTGASFTPTVQTSYVTAGSIVVGQGAYSTAIGYGGKRWCTAATPVAHSRTGATGATGATGPPGLSTRKVVFDVLSSGSQTNTTPFSFRPFNNLSTSYQIAVRDYAGNVRQKTSGHGYTEFLSANNAEVVRIMTDGTIMMMKNGVLRLHLKNDGSAIHYRNGQAVFQVWSTGRWKGGEGYPSSAAKQIPYVTPQGFRGYTSGGGGSGGGMSNPYTIPGASQTFRSQAGRVRFTFYSGQGLVIH